MGAFALNDAAFCHSKDASSEQSQLLLTYTKAITFERSLNEELKLKAKVENLACAG